MKSQGTNPLTLILVAALASALTYIATTKWDDIKSLADSGRNAIVASADSTLNGQADKAIPADSQAVAGTADSPATTTQDMPEGTVLFVNGDGVRLRTGPGLNYEIYKNVNKGQRLTYNYSSGEWYCVTFGGRNLFISKGFVDQNPVPATPTPAAKDAAKDSKDKKSAKDSKSKKKSKSEKSTKKVVSDSIAR